MEFLSARAISAEDAIESEKVATESGMDDDNKAVSPFHDSYLTQKPHPAQRSHWKFKSRVLARCYINISKFGMNLFVTTYSSGCFKEFID